MYPIAFYLGSFPIYSYGICIVVGTLALFGIAAAQARRAGRRQDHLVPMALGTLVGAFVGARRAEGAACRRRDGLRLPGRPGYGAGYPAS